MKTRAFLLLVPSCLAISSCSTTIVSSLESTTTVPVVTTTTIPTGDVQTLLAGMLNNTNGLGNLVADGSKAAARERLANVESIWIALEPKLTALNNDSQVDVERIVNLVRNAVNRKRPADADKAARFLPLVIDSLK